MIVRSAPSRISNSLSAHPILYGSAGFAPCASPHRPGQPLFHLSSTPTPALDITTDHAGLVLLGKYAQHLGLIERLQTIPLAQRTRTHTPQAKLIQFFVGILAGLDYLQDFNLSAQPLVTDHAVHAAWQQDAFAHYSGLSRTLAAADDATLTALQQALQEISRPFLEREVVALVRAGRPLIIDVDLTGRTVSPTSTTYPDADFGWMDDTVAKGYQAAITTLSGGPSGRLVLCSQRYPGRTKSAECLRAAVRQMEQVLGVRPRRRPELVRQRLTTLAPQLQQRRAAVETAQHRQEQLRRTTERVQAELVTLRDARTAPAELTPQAGKMRLSRLQQQAERLVGQRQAAADWCAKQEAHLRELEEQQQQLSTWLEELEHHNAEVVMPVRMVLRVDAGFSTGENVAWLIEAGYAVVTKAHSGLE